MSISTCVCVCVYACVCMYAYVCVCVYAYVFICVCIYMCVCCADWPQLKCSLFELDFKKLFSGKISKSKSIELILIFFVKLSLAESFWIGQLYQLQKEIVINSILYVLLTVVEWKRAFLYLILFSTIHSSFPNSKALCLFSPLSVSFSIYIKPQTH